MLARCASTNSKRYVRYAGRGITVCSHWLHSYENFLADMGERPLGHSLDRIDNNGNYEPANCKWSTRSEQSRNTCVQEYNGFCKLEFYEANKQSGSPAYKTYHTYLSLGIPKELAIHPRLGKLCSSYLKHYATYGYNSTDTLHTRHIKERPLEDELMTVVVPKEYTLGNITLRIYRVNRVNRRFQLKVRGIVLGSYSSYEEAMYYGTYIDSALAKGEILKNILYRLRDYNYAR